MKEEKPLRELRLPFDESSRLCFFALPLELLSQYRDKVFPAVEAQGFVPVTADDVLTPGDSVPAKIEALIRRATAVVVEPTTAATISEMSFALGRTKEKGPQDPNRRLFQVIVIREEGDVTPVMNVGESRLIYRSRNWFDDPEVFVGRLVEELRQLMPGGEQSRGGEARRLFDKGEHNAAVIAAISHLEATLREALAKGTVGTRFGAP